MLCSVYISGVEASGALPSAAPLMSCHSVNTDKHTHTQHDYIYSFGAGRFALALSWT